MENERSYKTDNSIAFNSYNENFILSNMYPCTIIYNNKLFYGVDHLYHYLRFDGHQAIQEAIMKKSKGLNANFIAKKIAEENNSILGKDKDTKLLYKCMKLKAEQCRQFKEALLNTGNKDLVEFAWWGDKYFGCTFNKQTNQFEGINATGRLMMQLREELNKG